VLIAASAFIALAVGMTDCSSGDKASTSGVAAGKIRVVASTNVWGRVLAAVGGDKVAVTSIINNPSADPHSYHTTAEDGLVAQNAKLLLGNGGGYDDFFTKLAAQAPGARKLVAYDIAATGDPNEHVWYNRHGVERWPTRSPRSLMTCSPPRSSRPSTTRPRSRPRSTACSIGSPRSAPPPRCQGDRHRAGRPLPAGSLQGD
jgi:hypothetical protein